MKKLIFTLALLVSAFVLFACGSDKGPNSVSHYFKDFKREHIAYNASAESHDKEGTHWTMESKQDQKITIKLRIQADSEGLDTTYLYVNNKQVQSDHDSFYDFSYELDLKKGDKLDIHSFYVFPSQNTGEGFQIQVMAIVVPGSSNPFLIDDAK